MKLFSLLQVCLLIVAAKISVLSASSVSDYNRTLSGILPAYTSNYVNVWEPVTTTSHSLPTFWYIGRSGGNTFAKIVAECLELTQCSSKGDSSGTVIPLAPPVQKITHMDDNGRYLNVNPNLVSGLYLLVSAGYGPNKLADILFTPRLEEAASLFSPSHPGRMITMLRHPVKRIVDQFYYRQMATWDPHYDIQLATMSISNFALSDKLIDNLVVRSLTGNHDGSVAVTPLDVEIAKNILREKFVVGIFEWYESSLSRFEKYLGWWDTYHMDSDAAMNHCHSVRIDEKGHVGEHPPVDAGSDLWKKLVIRSWADLELYTYAKALFAEQAALVATMSTLGNQ